MSDTETVIAIGEDYPELRDAVKNSARIFPASIGVVWKTKGSMAATRRNSSRR